jgi:asparagine synthase (glutamine-hydrolysing)
MCGISGVLQPLGSAVDIPALLASQALLRHRGPDAQGHYVDRQVGLAHTRLKIVDLSDDAAQPMTNEDGQVVVTFNGEIYNWRPLRDELVRRGHRFRSRCDTEVIVHGYEEWGEQCVERFNGMFAFALYDRAKGSVWLVRDRVGIKPLYYHLGPRGLAFASEIKALLALPGVPRELASAALGEYLLCRSLSGGQTLFAGVRALPPGHWLRVAPDLHQVCHEYWRPPLGTTARQEAPAARQEAMHALLRESVALQLMGDVPIGTQLSGGLDSSLITALAVGQVTHPVQSYSVGFADTACDESSYARQVGQALGAAHHEVPMDHAAFADLLPLLTWHYDEPLTHPNSAGIYQLCRVAKPTITVALTGEGADELFAGYRRYAWLQECALARRWVPPRLAQLPPPWSRLVPASLGRAMAHGLPELTVRATAIGAATLGPHLSAAELRESLERRLAWLAPAGHCSLLDQALYYDLKTYLPPILMRQDKMSMAHGMETRVPYLDHRVVEAAFALPARDKLHHGHGKVQLKRIAAAYLPRGIIHRRKVAFGFPLAAWLRERQGLGEQLDLLLDGHGLCATLVPRPQVRHWIEEHRSGQEDRSEPLWTLLALETWHRRFLATPVATVSASA